MYEQFYGLSRTPFAVTPDPAMLFMSPVHREALATIIYGVETRKGFLVCTGEVGTGKSTIIRAFFDQLQPDTVQLIYIFTPQVSPLEMAQYICAELGLPSADSVFAAVPRLQLKLLEVFESGRTVVLMIDEAQLIPPETLEFLRLLSNFETDTEKLIQIVLVGQPEVDTMLARQDMRQVNQRVALRARLAGLSIEETYEYLEHRLRVAGAADLAQVMSPSAAWLIAEAAGGIPRSINILADNALIAGFGAHQRPLGSQLTGRTIREFLAKSGPARPTPTQRRNTGWRAARMLRSALVRERHEPDSFILAPSPVRAAPPAAAARAASPPPSPATSRSVFMQPRPPIATPAAPMGPAEPARSAADPLQDSAPPAKAASGPAAPPVSVTPAVVAVAAVRQPSEPLAAKAPPSPEPARTTVPAAGTEVAIAAAEVPPSVPAVPATRPPVTQGNGAGVTKPAAMRSSASMGQPVSVEGIIVVSPTRPIVSAVSSPLRRTPVNGRMSRLATGVPVSVEGMTMVAPVSPDEMPTSRPPAAIPAPAVLLVPAAPPVAAPSFVSSHRTSAPGMPGGAFRGAGAAQPAAAMPRPPMPAVGGAWMQWPALRRIRSGLAGLPPPGSGRR